MKTSIKQQIAEFLKEKDITLSDFAEYINVSEAELQGDLDPNKLDLRTLEQICKVLRIPIYSCFARSNYTASFTSTVYFAKRKGGEKMRLNEMLIKALKERNMTLREFADSINISEQEFCTAFKPCEMNVRTLERISKELHVPFYSLLNTVHGSRVLDVYHWSFVHRKRRSLKFSWLQKIVTNICLNRFSRLKRLHLNEGFINK
ncbi:MAG: helix-turn-helix transcriptional regulator [Bacteroidetes bacterium]|nr:helix-turn-helix transcriptional regulator [Bacteroidota bacterium]